MQIRDTHVPIVVIYRRSAEKEARARSPLEAREHEGDHFVSCERNRHPECDEKICRLVEYVGLEC